MDWKNRAYCGNLSLKDKNKDIQLYGWIDTIRDHGHLLFMHLRDISGVVQIVFDPEKNKDTYDLAQTLRSEYVIGLKGKLLERLPENKNPQVPTGDIEVMSEHITLFSKAETPPFMITEKGLSEEEDAPTQFNVDEDLRLKYRYLDLRRPSMQENIKKRSQFMREIRTVLYEWNFNEIETPMLTKSTPEGARDYLVPSRLHIGEFYALPQSPQLFKQLLMMSGMDRYFQLTKCFRDEDLRPNRQPEFTQVDLEASFVDEEFIYELIETLLKRLFAIQNSTLSSFERISFYDAMNTYGSDAPDLRYDLSFRDVTQVFEKSGYKILQSISSSGGCIKGFVLKNQAEKLSKNMLQSEWAKKVVPSFGGKGMTWMKVENDALQSNIVQFMSDAEKDAIKTEFKTENGDVVVLIADMQASLVNEILGKLRCYAAEKLDLIDTSQFKACWITDFPLFELKNGQLSSMHHPFTQPSQDVLNCNTTEEWLKITANAYDIVINGEEIGGGSLRIHDTDVQKKIFEALGLSEKEITEKFGFFVDALKYGTPPHAGLALGLDRLIAMILQTNSIREIIAFPKNRMAFCPLTSAPSSVAVEQLQELNIIAKKPPPKNSSPE